jgi:hypothetical protein
MASNVSSLEVPFALLLYDPQTYRAVGLKLAINGSQATLLVDTGASGILLAWKIHDFRNTEGLAMVQIRCLGGFETKNEAFA